MDYVLYGLNNQKCCPNRSMSANKLYSTNQCIVTTLFSQSLRRLSSPLSSLPSFTMSALSSFRSTDQRCWVARWRRRGGSGGGFDCELQNLATESTRFTGLVVVGLLWKRRRLILAAGQSTVGQRVGCFGSAVYMGVWAMI